MIATSSAPEFFSPGAITAEAANEDYADATGNASASLFYVQNRIALGASVLSGQQRLNTMHSSCSSNLLISDRAGTFVKRFWMSHPILIFLFNNITSLPLKLFNLKL